MPQFLVVAGPNGAGKSTFSTDFSRPGALIFDPDEQKYKIEKQYPDISLEALESELTRKYNIFEAKAIGSRLLEIMMNETTLFRRKLTHCFGAN